jgi:hypothetical protein
VALVQSQSILCGIRGGQGRSVVGFTWVIRFPLSVLLVPNAPFLSAIICVCYNAPFTVEVPKRSVSHLPENKNLSLAYLDQLETSSHCVKSRYFDSCMKYNLIHTKETYLLLPWLVPPAV